MKTSLKILIGIVAIAMVGVGYWLISPLFISKQVNESLEDIVQKEEPMQSGEFQPATIAQGTFIGLAGHAGKGTATLVKVGAAYYVRFEEGFEVTNGPDLFVHLGRNGEYSSEARLGSLKGNVGSQNYEVPESIDVTKYNEVWVWCRAFSVPFAKAVLEIE